MAGGCRNQRSRPAQWLQTQGADTGHPRHSIGPAAGGIDQHRRGKIPVRRRDRPDSVAADNGLHRRAGDDLATVTTKLAGKSLQHAVDINILCIPFNRRGGDGALPQDRHQPDRLGRREPFQPVAAIEIGLVSEISSGLARNGADAALSIRNVALP